MLRFTQKINQDEWTVCEYKSTGMFGHSTTSQCLSKVLYINVNISQAMLELYSLLPWLEYQAHYVACKYTHIAN